MHNTERPGAALSVDVVLRRRHELASKPGEPLAEDPAVVGWTMFFPPDANFWHDGPVIDWSQPFPPIADRGPLVAWLESWIDVITFTEVTGRYPWEPEPAGAATFPPEALEILKQISAKVDKPSATVAAVGPTVIREVVVSTQNAPLTEMNVRLARTRTAYLENQGSVPAALKQLKRDGHVISRSTFYNHLEALDKLDPQWRAPVMVSNQSGQMDGMRQIGTRENRREH
jgi:hypothetical protein